MIDNILTIMESILEALKHDPVMTFIVMLFCIIIYLLKILDHRK